MTSNTSRVEALRDLVELRVSVSDALTRPSRFDWSSAHELITLAINDLDRALDRFDAGSLDEAGLCAWAEAVQGTRGRRARSGRSGHPGSGTLRTLHA